MWLYRLFKRNVDNTLITVDSSVTSGISVPAITVTGTTTQTGVATFTAAPVISNTPAIVGKLGGTSTPYAYKVMTVGNGSTIIDWWMTVAAKFSSTYGPTPSHIGDVLIVTDAGKMYIASGVSASTDWKLVTSA